MFNVKVKRISKRGKPRVYRLEADMQFNKNLLPFLAILILAVVTAVFVPSKVGTFTIGDALLWLASPTGAVAVVLGIIAAYFGWSANTTNVVAGVVLAAVGGIVQYLVGYIPAPFLAQQLLTGLFVLFSAVFGLGITALAHVKFGYQFSQQVHVKKLMATSRKGA